MRHTLETLVRQRVFQIACGYEDQDDADTLRTDPLLKLVCGRLPETGRIWPASRPCPAWRTPSIARAATGWPWPWASSICASGSGTACPTHIVLDIDGTDDPTHGAAGRERLPRLLPPAHVPPAAGLRRRDRPAHHRGAAPGQHPRQPGVVAVLKRVVRAHARPLAGGDASRCGWTAAARCPPSTTGARPSGVAYTIGLIPNAAPDGAGRPAAGRGAAPAGRQRRREGPPARRDGLSGRELGPPATGGLQGRGAAQGPQHPLRRHHPHRCRPRRSTTGTSPAATARTGSRTSKSACFADRLSDHRFWANQFRLLLHAAAYWLLDTAPPLVGARMRVARLQLDTLRLRLLKIGGRVYQLPRSGPPAAWPPATPASRSGTTSPPTAASMNNPG